MSKGIIFDFDGVIHDTFELAYEVAVSIYGKDFTREEYKSFFDGNLFEHKKVTKDNNFIEKISEGYKALKIEEEIEKVLIKLKKKFDLFIISSTSEHLLDFYLKNNDIHFLFKEVLGSETHKSKVKKFELLLNKHNLNKDEVLFVTDTLGDILEANKIGIKTIAVDFGFHERERLEKGKPIAIISKFDELINEIKKHF